MWGAPGHSSTCGEPQVAVLRVGSPRSQNLRCLGTGRGAWELEEVLVVLEELLVVLEEVLVVLEEVLGNWKRC